MAGFINRLFGMAPKADFKALLESGATLLDVRTKEEYNSGHVKNSINIPLNVLSSNLSKLDKSKAVVAVCQSGMRSGSAVGVLKSSGFDQVYNGGSWVNFR